MKIQISMGLAAALTTMTLSWSSATRADGVVINKVYHPYVDALEKEVEVTSIVQDRQKGHFTPAQWHQLALGRSFGQRWFGEFYFVGTKARDGHISLQAYEAEVKRQLTEQGEYPVDLGMIVEYEKDVGIDVQELSTGLLAEKEWGRFSGTANLFLIHEWGNDIRNEYESSLALQARYRYSPLFEPAVEFYSGQDSRGIGPVVVGSANVGIRKKISWEAGFIFGVTDPSPDQTFRFLFEYDF